MERVPFSIADFRVMPAPIDAVVSLQKFRLKCSDERIPCQYHHLVFHCKLQLPLPSVLIINNIVLHHAEISGSPNGTSALANTFPPLVILTSHFSVT